MSKSENDAEELLAQLTVMVIDDEIFMQSLVSRMLTDLGVKTVLVSDNGKQALSTLRSRYKEIDLILLDIEMPEIDGLKFLEMIRKTSIPEVAHLRVVMLSGHSDFDNIKRAIDLGVHGFLTKPVAKEKLKARIMTVISGDQLDSSYLQKLL